MLPAGPVYPVLPRALQLYSGGHVAVAWMLTVLTLGHLLPWAVAVTRQRSDIAGLVLIDIFLGWSLAGWIVSLVLACTDDRSVAVLVVPPGYGPAGYDPASYGPTGHGGRGRPGPYGPATPLASPYSAPSAPDPRALGRRPPTDGPLPPDGASEPTARLPWSGPDPAGPPGH